MHMGLVLGFVLSGEYWCGEEGDAEEEVGEIHGRVGDDI
jgi:hypothetical protein